MADILSQEEVDALLSATEGEYAQDVYEPEPAYVEIFPGVWRPRGNMEEKYIKNSKQKQNRIDEREAEIRHKAGLPMGDVDDIVGPFGKIVLPKIKSKFPDLSDDMSEDDWEDITEDLNAIHGEDELLDDMGELEKAVRKGLEEDDEEEEQIDPLAEEMLKMMEEEAREDEEVDRIMEMEMLKAMEEEGSDYPKVIDNEETIMLDIDKELLYKVMLLAHESDVKTNDLICDILQEYMGKNTL